MTRQIRLLVSTALLLGSSLYSFSATVTVDEARAIASEFIGSRAGISPDKVKLETAYTAGSEKSPLYYVFNAADKGGFVIISADNTTTPVLGYSFDGSYPVNTVPDAMQWMMTGLEREIKAAPSLQSGRTIADRKGMARSAAMQSAEQKLLPTPDWSQEAPFNSLIPGRPLVGCVGTAMATVMKYHQWPESGTGSFDGVDFGVNYDWASMRTDNYRSGYTAAEGEAVATLMYHASKSIDTQYAM